MKSFLFALCLLASVSFAEKNPASATTMSGKSSSTSLGISGGLVTVSGDYGGAFLLDVQSQVDKTAPVRLGLETGLMFGSGTGLPILVDITWYMGERAKHARPYVGAALGPVIGIGSGGFFDMGPLGSSVRLAIMLRGGLSFQVADALDLKTELMMGGLTGLFYISPMVGLQVHL